MANSQPVNGMRRMSIPTAHRRLRRSIGAVVVVYTNPGMQSGILRSAEMAVSDSGRMLRLEVDTAFGYPQFRRGRVKVIELGGDRYFWPLCPILVDPGGSKEAMLGVDRDL